MRIKYEGTQRERREARLKRDNLLSLLVDATPEAVDQWVEDNITSLMDVKQLLKLLLLKAL